MKHSEFADLYTPEGEALCGQPWDCYPRPQLQRDSFYNLNGIWEFTLSADSTPPAHYGETILVPFPPQSLLSGVHRECPEDQFLFYRKTFSLPLGFQSGRVLLHVGAADQVTDVWLNGTHLGNNVGGYHSFSFDLTPYLQEENTLVLRVSDSVSDRILPRGKQSAKRGGMWYTPVSGIWQTVWLECVPLQYIKHLHIRTQANQAEISVVGDVPDGTVTVYTPDGELEVKLLGGKAVIRPEQPRLWSPEDPYLYHCTIRAGADCVRTYFALRTLSIQQIGDFSRLCLNGKPYFFHGVLDQGYWSDGLFTPAHPSCYEKDILAMKALGFNTLRKHIKIEPELFYYHCDRLGMIVFQDMVNNGGYNFLRDTALPTLGFKHRKDKRMHRSPAARAAFWEGMERTVQQLYNHPCICYWTIFNEGWGQFESTKAYLYMKELDPARFVGTVSGWFKGGESDVVAEHVYFKPFRPAKSQKPLLLTEFGGYSFEPQGHAFHPGHVYGYRRYQNRTDFANGLRALYLREILPAVEKGLCAAIYTQLSDVEDETNGLLSYDRKVQKISSEEMLPIAAQLYAAMEHAVSLPKQDSLSAEQ